MQLQFLTTYRSIAYISAALPMGTGDVRLSFVAGAHKNGVDSPLT